MQRLRDNPACADAENDWRCDADDPGITPKLTFDPAEDVAAPYIAKGARPRVAILREQGVNGQIEMAAAFTRAGFDAVDVHMTDLQSGRSEARRFQRLRRVRRLLATATCSARAAAGPHRSSTTMRCASSSRRSSPTERSSRSASATAARCSRR